MKKFYCIESGNEKIENLQLFFKTKNEAVAWCKSCTIWSDEEIEKNIFVTHVYFK